MRPTGAPGYPAPEKGAGSSLRDFKLIPEIRLGLSGDAKVWKDYDAIIDARRSAWNWLIADPDGVRSLGSREWATVNVQGSWYQTQRTGRGR